MSGQFTNKTFVFTLLLLWISSLLLTGIGAFHGIEFALLLLLWLTLDVDAN